MAAKTFWVQGTALLQKRRNRAHWWKIKHLQMAGTRVCDRGREGPEVKLESWFGPGTGDLECIGDKYLEGIGDRSPPSRRFGFIMRVYQSRLHKPMTLTSPPSPCLPCRVNLFTNSFEGPVLDHRYYAGGCSPHYILNTRFRKPYNVESYTPQVCDGQEATAGAREGACSKEPAGRESRLCPAAC